MKTDNQLKAEATQRAKYMVFELKKAPAPIKVSCSDGEWVRNIIYKANNRFTWGKWEKVS